MAAALATSPQTARHFRVGAPIYVGDGRLGSRPEARVHTAIDGPGALDTDHGCREIHPADSIQIG
jgi:hypothetical protein